MGKLHKWTFLPMALRDHNLISSFFFPKVSYSLHVFYFSTVCFYLTTWSLSYVKSSSWGSKDVILSSLRYKEIKNYGHWNNLNAKMNTHGLKVIIVLFSFIECIPKSEK